LAGVPNSKRLNNEEKFQKHTKDDEETEPFNTLQVHITFSFSFFFK
jgi:hypothetical protein